MKSPRAVGRFGPAPRGRGTSRGVLTITRWLRAQRVTPAYGQRSRFERQERQAVRGPAEEGHEQGPGRGDLQRERRLGQRRLEEGRQEQLVGWQQPEQQEQR